MVLELPVWEGDVPSGCLRVIMWYLRNPPQTNEITGKISSLLWASPFCCSVRVSWLSHDAVLDFMVYFASREMKRRKRTELEGIQTGSGAHP